MRTNKALPEWPKVCSRQRDARYTQQHTILRVLQTKAGVHVDGIENQVKGARGSQPQR
jgi:hypothetical protein